MFDVDNFRMVDKSILKEFLEADAVNYKSQYRSWIRKIKFNAFSNPISEQKYIWLYIKALRYVEYYQNTSGGIINRLFMLWWLRKLRKYSHITSFQIPHNVCGKGLTIWHWGSIIINPEAKIGDNCTLYPGVLIGHKAQGGGAATIGNNVFIGAGTKIIGPVKIGDNVIVGQNCVITKDIPNNSVVVNGCGMRLLK